MIVSNTYKFVFLSTPHTNSAHIRKILCRLIPNDISFYSDTLNCHEGIRGAMEEMNNSQYDVYYFVRNPYHYLWADYNSYKGVVLDEISKLNTRRYTKQLRFNLINPTFETFLKTFHDCDSESQTSLYSKYEVDSPRLTYIPYQFEDFSNSLQDLVYKITKKNQAYNCTPDEYDLDIKDNIKRKIRHKFAADFIKYKY